MFFTKQMLGMDLGSYSIKVARISNKRGKLFLNKFGNIAVPLNTIVDGSIMNTYEMNDAIKTLLAREKIRDKYCAISIAGHGIINRIIDVPDIEESEFFNAMKVEAETHIPHDINEIYFDGIKTGVSESGKNKVILIAARKDLVGDFIQVVSDAGVRPMSVEIDATALANIFEVNYQEELDSTVVLVNVGSLKMNVVVLKNGNIAFFRDIPTGGNFITEEISRRLKVNYQQAEGLKSGAQISGDAILPNQVEEVVASVADSMVSDITRVLDFYSNTSGDEKISKIYITGGTTKSHTFVSTLASKLEFTVEKLNPFKEIVVPPNVLSSEEVEDYSHFAAISLGLALRRVDEA